MGAVRLVADHWNDILHRPLSALKILKFFLWNILCVALKVICAL